MKHIFGKLRSKASYFALVAAATVTSTAAFAVDPTYTSQIGDALGAVNMTDIVTDVTAFAGVGFTLLLATKGVLYVSKLLGKFLR